MDKGTPLSIQIITGIIVKNLVSAKNYFFFI